MKRLWMLWLLCYPCLVLAAYPGKLDAYALLLVSQKPADVKVGTRHSGGFIAIFCDGHAKWQPGPDKVHCGMWSIEAGD